MVLCLISVIISFVALWILLKLYEESNLSENNFGLLFTVAFVIAIISICSTVARFDLVEVTLKQTLENGMQIQTKEKTKKILVKASDTIGGYVVSE